MKAYLIKRLLTSVFVLWGVTVLAFMIVRLTPGDPAYTMLPPQANEEQREAFRESLGIGEPLIQQYGLFLSDIFSGTIGWSVYHNQTVLSLIIERFAATFELAVIAVFIAIAISIPAGVISAVHRDEVADYAATFIALFGVSMPNFWFGILLILVFSVWLGLFPVHGYPEYSSLDAIRYLVFSGTFYPLVNFLSHILLPAIALGTYMTAVLTRTMRSSMLEELGEEYIDTARVKGLPESTVIMRHTVRNAVLPTITIFGLYFAALLGGSIVIETVFSWPGIGRLIIDSVLRRDYPVVQGIILFVAFFYIIVNTIVDMVYTVLDPRISY